MQFSRVFGALTLILSWQPALASVSWTCLRSANFELYTTDSEKTGRDALSVFEQIRSAFRDILGVKIPVDKPVTIVAFRNEAEYAPYQLHNGAVGYYLPLPNHDFIVIQDLLPEHYPLILHEYTHLIINQAGMKLPLWLNEGFAELYATMTPVHGKILVGRIIPARLQVAQAGLGNLRDILAADTRSPAYNENNRIGIFYAESWALTHMLKFSRSYSPKFERLLDAIGRGEPSDKALEQVYGKSIEAIQSDLQAYVHGQHFREGVIEAKMMRFRADPEVTPKDPLDTAVMLAIIQSHGARSNGATATLEQLAQANPGRPAPLDALAWIDLSGPDPRSAMQPFHRTLEAGTHDAALCYTYAVKLRATLPQSEYLAALRRATEIAPDLSAAQQLLAAYAFDSHDYAEAVARLHLVKKLDRVNAFTYYRALALAAFQVGKISEAQSAVDQLKQYASTPEEHRLADAIARHVAGESPDTLH